MDDLPSITLLPASVWAEETMKYRQGSEDHSEVMLMGSITIDGIEFFGVESLFTAGGMDTRYQSWSGDIDGVVIEVTLGSQESGPVDPELVVMLESLTFEPA